MAGHLRYALLLILSGFEPVQVDFFLVDDIFPLLYIILAYLY